MKIKNLFFFSAFSFFVLLTSCYKEPMDYSKAINDLNAQVTALQNRSDSLANALKITNNNISSLSKTVDSIKTQLASINTQLVQLNAQLTSVNVNITLITSQISTLNQQYTYLLSQLTAILNQLSGGTPATLNTGLLAYYQFSGNAADSSGNGYNGIVNGATLVTDRIGVLNSAYQFTGSNNITIPLTQSNILNYSICSWFKTTAGGVIVGGRGSVTGAAGLTLKVQSNSLSATYLGQILWGNDNNYGEVGQMSSSKYLDDKWHYVVGTFSSSSQLISPSDFKIYVDGVLLSSLTVNSSSPTPTSPINNNNTNMLIGNHQKWSNAVFNGTLDDIRIYNRVLTQTEISYLANH